MTTLHALSLPANAAVYRADRSLLPVGHSR